MNYSVVLFCIPLFDGCCLLRCFVLLSHVDLAGSPVPDNSPDGDFRNQLDGGSPSLWPQSAASLCIQVQGCDWWWMHIIRRGKSFNWFLGPFREWELCRFLSTADRMRWLIHPWIYNSPFSQSKSKLKCVAVLFRTELWAPTFTAGLPLTLRRLPPALVCLSTTRGSLTYIGSNISGAKRMPQTPLENSQVSSGMEASSHVRRRGGKRNFRHWFFPASHIFSCFCLQGLVFISHILNYKVTLTMTLSDFLVIPCLCSLHTY